MLYRIWYNTQINTQIDNFEYEKYENKKDVRNNLKVLSQ